MSYALEVSDLIDAMGEVLEQLRDEHVNECAEDDE